MKIFQFILFAVASWLLTIVAYLFAPLIALCVNSTGDLPAWLRWFQTSDAPAWGANFWAIDNPTYSRYKLIITWLWRNPAQGFDQYAKANITPTTPVTVRGTLGVRDTPPQVGGWFLITGGGYFQLSIIWPLSFACLVSHLGWNLEPIAKGYSHATLGALKATPLRFYIGA